MTKQDSLLADLAAELEVVSHRLQDYLAELRTVGGEDRADEASGIAATSLLVMVAGAVTLGASSMKALIRSNEQVRNRKEQA
jgi:glyoxylate utilization-related uncharacterized protein